MRKYLLTLTVALISGYSISIVAQVSSKFKTGEVSAIHPQEWLQTLLQRQHDGLTGLIFTNHDLLTDIMPFENGGYYNYDRLLYLAGQSGTVSIKEATDNVSDAARWFTLDGRRLSSLPVTKGIYLRNGQKHVRK